MTMRERLLVFEDAACRHFAPLSHTRPVYELRVGLMGMRERCELAFGSEAELVCRPHLAAHTSATAGRRVNEPEGRDQRALVLVNGRVRDPFAVEELLAAETGPARFMNGDELVAARVPADATAGLFTNLTANGFLLDPGMVVAGRQHVAAVELFDQSWELARDNGAQIRADLGHLGWMDDAAGELPSGVQQIGDEPLILAAGAVIEPGTVLDRQAGPIILGRDVRVCGPSRLEGPLAVGAGSLIVGGRIRSGTTIGPGCRIAGEVEASIFHGHANKYHDGFIGHAYVGEWVNLGAMTTNSDLKNTYGTVKVWRDGTLIDTGEQKVGAMIGDHVKTGIGTLLDTGAVVGVAANIFGGSAVLGCKWFPSFSWGTPPKLVLHDPARALVTMQEVMSRRGVTLSAAYRDLIDEVFALSKREREFAGIHDI
jgi:UDP-N-acetylglucosamine diphosphorylase / glucose-1-phosphate thymidylyltransferase / UDP-N-acetylgalactosamine diphosphorylase / glucosamine-1-phosphate N-acetyltransferase / galactosamine-1-phosphate N-acetyltransferase